MEISFLLFKNPSHKNVKGEIQEPGEIQRSGDWALLATYLMFCDTDKFPSKLIYPKFLEQKLTKSVN